MLQKTTAQSKISRLKKRVRIVRGGTSSSKTFSIIPMLITYAVQNKGMEIYAWCIMPSHVHLMYRAKDNNPGDLLRDFKTFTSKKIRELIQENPQESRKEWMLWIACPALDAGIFLI